MFIYLKSQTCIYLNRLKMFHNHHSALDCFKTSYSDSGKLDETFLKSLPVYS